MNISFPKQTRFAMTAGDLAARVGDHSTLFGNPAQVVESVASPKDALSGSLVFCSQQDPQQLLAAVNQTNASVIVVSTQIDMQADRCMIVVKDPLAWFIKALHVLFDFKRPAHIHPTAQIAPTAALADNVEVGPGVVIEEHCKIGKGCRIGANTYLGPGTILGENVFIQNNASLGSVGLGYHLADDGERLFFPHLGAVIVGNNAVLGVGCVIVRGQMDDTVIGNSTRIGNMVNIGHNVHVGDDCAISSSTSIAGGVHIGDRCNIAVGVNINAKISIGADCKLGLGSVITKSLPPAQSVFGNPARSLPTMGKF